MKLFGNKKNATHGEGKKRGRLRKVVTVLLCVTLLAAGGVYGLANWYIRPPEVSVYVPQTTPVPDDETVLEGATLVDPDDDPAPDSNRPSGIYTVLVVGQDEAGGNTDTMILAAVDSVNGTVNMVNIPRDTMVDVPWQPRKLNSVLTGTGSIDGLMDAVEELTGFRPDNYVVVDLDGFVALVDAIGPVEFDVPRNMSYTDPDQNLTIQIPAGLQELDGEQALGVVRWRQNDDGTGYIDGDIGRIQTQQDFLKAVAKQLLQIDNVTKINELAEIFIKYVDTDLPLSSLIWYATQLMGMDSEDINFLTMPGNYDAWYSGTSYVLVDVDEWLDMVNEYLNPFPDEVTRSNVSIYTTDETGVLTTIGRGLTLTAYSG